MSVITLIQTFDDLYIDSSQPNANFSNLPALKIGKLGDTTYRLLYKFDLSFIPVGSTILSSNLNFYLEDDASGIGREAILTVYAVSNDWEPQRLTWNNQPKLNSVITGASIKVAETGYYSLPVTNFVDQWVNGGIQNTGLELRTEESETDDCKGIVGSLESVQEKQGYKPVLVIEYKPGRTLPVNIDTVVTGRDINTAHESVKTEDKLKSTTIRKTSYKSLVSFFVNNLTPHAAEVGIEVSSDGVNFLREKARTISQGVGIFVPSYHAAYSRLYYKSSIKGESTTLSIDYIAQLDPY